MFRTRARLSVALHPRYFRRMVLALACCLATGCVTHQPEQEMREPQIPDVHDVDSPPGARAASGTREPSATAPGAAAAVSSQPASSAPALNRAEGWFEKKRARKLEKRQQPADRRARPENSRRRAEERRLRRLNENGELPANGLWRAKLHSDRMQEARSETFGEARSGDGAGADAGLGPWEWLGPGNIGGRVRALLIRPDRPRIMWAGSAGGGIWKTTDGGDSWRPLNDFLASIAIGCMALDPNDPNIVYAGTGESFAGDGLPGAGIFKSTDGGETWTQLPATAPPVTDPPINPTSSGANPWAYVNRLSVNPADSDIILAATDTGIWRSADAGQTWSQSATVTRRTVDIRFEPEFPGRRAVAGLTNGTVQFSDDSGLTWSASDLDDNLFTTRAAVDFKAGDTRIRLNSTAGFVIRDRIQIGSGLAQETVSISNVDDGNFVQLASGLSRDYANGTPVSQLLWGRSELAWGSGETVYASLNTGGGTIYRSDDAGETFTVLERPDRIPNYFCSAFFTFDDINSCQGNYDNTIWVDPTDNNAIIVGGVDLWRDRNVSDGLDLQRISNWEAYHLGTSAHADNHTIVAHPDYDGDGNTTVFVGNDGGVQRADDAWSRALGTLGWVNLANNLGITQFSKGAANPSGSVIVGGAQDNGMLRFNADAGAQKWVQCIDCTGDGGYCSIDPRFPNVIYHSTQNLTVWKSITGGSVYLPAGIGLDDSGGPSLFIAPVVMDQNNPDTLLAGGASIWRTTNGALNWNSIRGAVSGNVSAIAVANGNSAQVWAGYSDGRVARTDGRRVTTWVDVNANGRDPLPGRFVTDIAIHPENPSEVFVAFGGYGGDSIWYTNDNGATWLRRNGPNGATSAMNAPATELPPVQVNAIVTHPSNGNWIYVGTDLGVYASEDKGRTWGRNPALASEGHEGPVNTEVADLFWQSNRLIAATHGRGMYRSGEILGAGCVEVCMEVGAACRADCSASVTDCGSDCGDLLDTCNSTCLQIGATCRAPCVAAGNACRRACDATSDGCVRVCEGTLGRCEAGCEGVGNICRSGCETVFGDCGTDCNTTGNSCRSVCTSTFNGCNTICTNVGSNCRNACESTGNTCRLPCVSAGNVCRSGCETARATCRNACFGVQACLDACDSGAQTCNTGCNNTQNACVGICNTAETACDTGCNTAQSTCTSVCTLARNTCDGVCNAAEGTCNATCGPARTTCLSACDRTQSGCTSVCTFTRNTCVTACEAPRGLCRRTCDTVQGACEGSCEFVENNCTVGCSAASTGCERACRASGEVCTTLCNTAEGACAELCGNCGTTTCATRDASCRSTCTSTAATCRSPCQAAGNVCRSACTVGDRTCRGACTAARDTCRTACDALSGALRTECLAGCDGIAARCGEACNGATLACNTACDGVQSLCEAPCNTAENSCFAVCEQTNTVCETFCESALGGQVPGDCNQDAQIDLSDSVCLLGFLFLGNRDELPCGAAGDPEPDGGGSCDAGQTPTADIGLLDHNGDGSLDLTDAIAALRAQFLGDDGHCLGSRCVEIPDCPPLCDL